MDPTLLLIVRYVLIYELTQFITKTFKSGKITYPFRGLQYIIIPVFVCYDTFSKYVTFDMIYNDLLLFACIMMVDVFKHLSFNCKRNKIHISPFTSPEFSCQKRGKWETTAEELDGKKVRDLEHYDLLREFWRDETDIDFIDGVNHIEANRPRKKYTTVDHDKLGARNANYTSRRRV